MLAHAVGWPVVEGGSARITDALLAEITAAGGELHTGRWIADLGELPPARVTLLDVTPAPAAASSPASGCRRATAGRSGASATGPGVCKVDWALERAGALGGARSAARAATVHLGGTLEEIAPQRGRGGRRAPPASARSASPCSRAWSTPAARPTGQQTFCAYCHVPPGSTVDMSERIEAQIERFAPGFRDLVLARSTVTAAETERHNPNYVGGDINGGAATLAQTIFRPTVSPAPLRHAAARRLPVLLLDAPGRRRARHVRRGRRACRTARAHFFVTVSATAAVPAPRSRSLPAHWATKSVLTRTPGSTSEKLPLEVTMTDLECHAPPSVA